MCFVHKVFYSMYYDTSNFSWPFVPHFNKKIFISNQLVCPLINLPFNRVWKEITLNASSDQSQYRVWDYPIKEQYGHILYAIEQGGPVPNASVGFQRVSIYIKIIHSVWNAWLMIMFSLALCLVSSWVNSVYLWDQTKFNL